MPRGWPKGKPRPKKSQPTTPPISTPKPEVQIITNPDTDFIGEKYSKLPYWCVKAALTGVDADGVIKAKISCVI